MGRWACVKLANVLDVQNGYAFDSKVFGDAGMPLIRIRDLKGGGSTETRYAGEFDAKYVVNAGDYLIGMDGEFACYEWKGEPALLNQRVCRLQGFDDALDARFLFYGVNSHLKAIEAVTGYTTVKHLSSKQVLGIELLVPPKAEQRRIVALLDEAFDAIATAKANTDRNLQNAYLLLKSESEQLLTDTTARCLEQPLEAVASILSGFAFRSVDFSAGPGLKCVKITNVGVGEFVQAGGDSLPFDFASKYGAFSVSTGSIVLALTRTIIGAGLKVAVVPAAFDRSLLNQRVAAITVRREKFASDFLFAYLRSHRVRTYVQARVNTLMQPNLSIADLRRLPVPVPPIAAQEKLVEKLALLSEKIDCLAAMYQLKLAALDELKKSLLHQAFSGQLTAKSTNQQAQALL